ncbi:hypothetical protein MXD81_29225 [Microbacteriaceae bacterium K1510]|nr:hypothetical protein [Microbacteriaceae bacterium K1510]
MKRLVLNTTTDLMKVPPEAVIKLLDGRRGVVVENMGDGQWLSCRLDGEDDDALVHSQDIAEVHTQE